METRYEIELEEKNAIRCRRITNILKIKIKKALHCPLKSRSFLNSRRLVEFTPITRYAPDCFWHHFSNKLSKEIRDMKIDTPSPIMIEENVVNIRAMKCEQSVLSRADGSVILSQGNTVVMASVFGPLEAKIQKELPDRMYVEVNCKPKVGMPGVSERGKEKLIKTTCDHIILTHMHPRTAVNVTIQEMQDGGMLLAASINAACLALLDSGLPLQCQVAAATCLVNERDEIILDPSLNQIKEGYKAVLTFAFDNRKHEVVLSHCEGRVPNDVFRKCLHRCLTASHAVFAFYREAIQRKFSKELL